MAITGAGVSAESGVPTFRGAEGLWNNYDPHQLATPEAFARDPLLVWRFYDWRREKIRPARPNPAHDWLAAYERLKDNFLLITQNVDGLHGLAGSREVVEIHGNLWRVRCTGCGDEQERREVFAVEERGMPVCNRCGALVRPAVVWFGEPLDEATITRAARASTACDLMLVLGTSAEVYPVAGLPGLAKKATVVEINPQPTPLTETVALSIRAPVAKLLAPLLP